MRNSKENGQAIASTSQTRMDGFEYDYTRFRVCEGEVASVKVYQNNIIIYFATDDGRGA